jgi:hypothetical protein
VVYITTTVGRYLQTLALTDFWPTDGGFCLGQIAEHPFGTIKHSMNQGYFLTRGLTNVRTEMSLTMLAYSIKRVIRILGVSRMIAALAVLGPSFLLSQHLRRRAFVDRSCPICHENSLILCTFHTASRLVRRTPPLQLAQLSDLWYNIADPVLLCTRFPIPIGGAGATDRHGKLNNLKPLATLLVTILLFIFAAWKGGVMNLMCAAAVELGVHLAIKVGSRVESRT